jgi:hypothetical protein
MEHNPPTLQGIAYYDLLGLITGFFGFLVRQLNFWVFGPEGVLCFHIGARAVRIRRLLGGMPLMLLLIIAAFALEGPRGYEMLAVTLLVVVAFLCRNYEAWDTLKSGGEPRHTFFMGESVLLSLEPILPGALVGLLHDSWKVYRFVHPAIVIGFGALVYGTNGSLVVTGYLVVSGILMASKNGLLFSVLVDQVLNQYDAAQARYHIPRLIQNAAQGTSPGMPHAGMPVSPTLLNILRSIPSPEMDEIVREAMSSNGAEPPPVQQELPYA